MDIGTGTSLHLAELAMNPLTSSMLRGPGCLQVSQLVKRFLTLPCEVTRGMKKGVTLGILVIRDVELLRPRIVVEGSEH